MPGRKGFLYRRCPQCQVVLPASEFPRATGPTFVIAGQQRRKCLQCGFIGMLMSFQVAERPAEPDEGTSS
jgi:hypothetical protein